MRSLPILLAFSAQAANAQDHHLAIINDPDGFTYVRQRPGTQAPVALILKKRAALYGSA